MNEDNNLDNKVNEDENLNNNNNNLEMKCDYCEFAGLFHCAHPQRWIEPFIKGCNLFEPLPCGGMRAKVDYNLECYKCNEKFPLEEMYSGAKGSKYLCKKYYEE